MLKEAVAGCRSEKNIVNKKQVQSIQTLHQRSYPARASASLRARSLARSTARSEERRRRAFAPRQRRGDARCPALAEGRGSLLAPLRQVLGSSAGQGAQVLQGSSPKPAIGFRCEGKNLPGSMTIWVAPLLLRLHPVLPRRGGTRHQAHCGAPSRPRRLEELSLSGSRGQERSPQVPSPTGRCISSREH